MISTIVSWKNISQWSSTGMLKASVFYIGLSALASKSLSQLSEVPIGDKVISLELPFFWQILFFGSLCYIAGFSLYTFLCPYFIKTHPLFSDMRGSGYIGSDLQEEFQALVDQKIKLPDDFSRDIDTVLGFLTAEEDEERHHYSGLLVSGSCSELIAHSIANNDIENSREAYNLISKSWEKQYIPAKFFAAALYSLFFLSMLIVLVQNIYFVVTYLLA